VALQVSPPFVISAEELRQLAEVLTAALDAALR
jgi:adenosylmethionine-8-amino-7-oxononanoate aminotransferase